MTLLINEIHFVGDLHHGLIVNAADRRITRPDGSFDSNHRKIFKIDHLNAVVGYFGVAQVASGEYLSSWIPNFIALSAATHTMEEFAHSLRGALNSAVYRRVLLNNPSGFHICGYNPDNMPELWFVRNIRSMDGNNYRDLEDAYFQDEDFLARDARNNFGFDGTSLKVKMGVQYYVNGDVRPFHAAWRRLDGFGSEMFAGVGFRAPSSLAENEAFVRWKLHTIATFYRQFSQSKIIGAPIDVISLLPN